MTRTTFKALWIGGSGVLATWLAVSPNHGVPATPPAAAVRRPASAAAPTAEELKLLAARLRKPTAHVTLRPSTRNPFRYSSPKSPSGASRERRVQSAAIEPTIQAAPPAPTLKLSGVAQKGATRTAILSGDGQIYVVGVGDSVAGRYTVIAIDPEAVLLRDAAGAEQRLVLPQ
jgi:Tfp pilus assembly protein PilP